MTLIPASFSSSPQGAVVDEIENALNSKRSSSANGIGSGDLRQYVNVATQAGRGGKRAEMFGHRRLYIGSQTLLGGADAIIFTGGIGENSAPARKAILSRLEALGCKMDEARNKAVAGNAGVISTENSKLTALVIPTNEELMIARETFRVLSENLKK